MPVDGAHNVLLDQISGQIELKGGEGRGGDGDPVLPLLAVGQQLLLLQAGDVGLALPHQQAALLLSPHQQHQDIHREQAHQDRLKDHPVVVGVPDHLLGHALGIGLDQHIFAVGHMEHAQIVRQAARSADKALLPRAVPDDLPGSGGGLAVDNPGLQQHIRQEAVVDTVEVGGGDDLPRPGTQKDGGRLAKVVGLQHLLEIVLGKIQPQQHPEDLVLMAQGGVVDHGRLSGNPGVKHHVVAALPPHAVDEVGPVGAVVGRSAGSQIDSLRIGEAQGVEVRVHLQLGQHLRRDIGLGQRDAQKIAVVTDPPHGVGELTFNPQGGLPGRIHRVVQAAVLNPLAVCGGIPQKQQADRRQQDQYVQHVLPSPFCAAHRTQPPLHDSIQLYCNTSRSKSIALSTK